MYDADQERRRRRRRGRRKRGRIWGLTTDACYFCSQGPKGHEVIVVVVEAVAVDAIDDIAIAFFCVIAVVYCHAWYCYSN